MNKSRMIVTLIIVLGVVGSAFVFTPKKGNVFCVSVEGPNLNCIPQNYKLVATGTDCWIMLDWDGLPANCHSDNCPTLKHCEIN